MILSNLAKAVREQNYYAVALEFLIVIAGVVIGFQIQAWNQNRADRETEQTYLMRLHRDMVRSVCSIQLDVDAVNNWRTRAQRTLDALLTNDPDGVEENGFELIASTRVNTGSLFRPTMNELVNGGQMNLISDDTLRTRIAEADAQFTYRSDLIQILATAQPSFVGQVQNRLRPIPGELYVVTYDFEALANDDDFINALGHALRNTHVNHLWLAEMVDIADGLRIAVAELINEDTSPVDCELVEAPL